MPQKAEFCKKYDCHEGQTVKNCYRKKALVLHPDKTRDGGTAFTALGEDYAPYKEPFDITDKLCHGADNDPQIRVHNKNKAAAEAADAAAIRAAKAAAAARARPRATPTAGPRATPTAGAGATQREGTAAEECIRLTKTPGAILSAKQWRIISCAIVIYLLWIGGGTSLFQGSKSTATATATNRDTHPSINWGGGAIRGGMHRGQVVLREPVTLNPLVSYDQSRIDENIQDCNDAIDLVRTNIAGYEEEYNRLRILPERTSQQNNDMTAAHKLKMLAEPVLRFLEDRMKKLRGAEQQVAAAQETAIAAEQALRDLENENTSAAEKKKSSGWWKPLFIAGSVLIAVAGAISGAAEHMGADGIRPWETTGSLKTVTIQDQLCTGPGQSNLFEGCLRAAVALEYNHPGNMTQYSDLGQEFYTLSGANITKSEYDTKLAEVDLEANRLRADRKVAYDTRRYANQMLIDHNLEESERTYEKYQPPMSFNEFKDKDEKQVVKIKMTLTKDVKKGDTIGESVDMSKVPENLQEHVSKLTWSKNGKAGESGSISVPMNKVYPQFANPEDAPRKSTPIGEDKIYKGVLLNKKEDRKERPMGKELIGPEEIASQMKYDLEHTIHLFAVTREELQRNIREIESHKKFTPREYDSTLNFMGEANATVDKENAAGLKKWESEEARRKELIRQLKQIDDYIKFKTERYDRQNAIGESAAKGRELATDALISRQKARDANKAYHDEYRTALESRRKLIVLADKAKEKLTPSVEAAQQKLVALVGHEVEGTLEEKARALTMLGNSKSGATISSDQHDPMRYLGMERPGVTNVQQTYDETIRPMLNKYIPAKFFEESNPVTTWISGAMAMGEHVKHLSPTGSGFDYNIVNLEPVPDPTGLLKDFYNVIIKPANKQHEENQATIWSEKMSQRSDDIFINLLTSGGFSQEDMNKFKYYSYDVTAAQPPGALHEYYKTNIARTTLILSQKIHLGESEDMTLNHIKDIVNSKFLESLTEMGKDIFQHVLKKDGKGNLEITKNKAVLGNAEQYRQLLLSRDISSLGTFGVQTPYWRDRMTEIYEASKYIVDERNSDNSLSGVAVRLKQQTVNILSGIIGAAGDAVVKPVLSEVGQAVGTGINKLTLNLTGLGDAHEYIQITFMIIAFGALGGAALGAAGVGVGIAKVGYRAASGLLGDGAVAEGATNEPTIEQKRLMERAGQRVEESNKQNDDVQALMDSNTTQETMKEFEDSQARIITDRDAENIKIQNVANETELRMIKAQLAAQGQVQRANLGGGKKRATKKHGKRKSKRNAKDGARKTKTTRKKTTRKKRHGKK